MDVELARLDAKLTGRWAGLPRPIVVEWSEVSVFMLDRGTPWLVGPADCDPLRNRAGQPILPRQQRAQLRRIWASGVRFNRIALAHELDPAGLVHPLLPLLESGPHACTEAVARLVVGPAPPHPAIERAVRALEAILGGGMACARQTLETLLDPIVFGVVAPGTPRAGEPSLWYPLVAWRW
jgi:hypothetical protein